MTKVNNLAVMPIAFVLVGLSFLGDSTNHLILSALGAASMIYFLICMYPKFQDRALCLLMMALWGVYLGHDLALLYHRIKS